MGRFWRSPWVPPALWAGVLFVFSSGPGPQVPIHVRHIDKVEHALAYAVLGALTARAFAASWPLLAVRSRIIASGGAAGFYGITDEVHQAFVPRRESSGGDALADAFGAYAGALLHLAWTSRRRRDVESASGERLP